MKKRSVRIGAGLLGGIGLIMLLTSPEYREFLGKCMVILGTLECLLIATTGKASFIDNWKKDKSV